jgi:hypothetical protein
VCWSLYFKLNTLPIHIAIVCWQLYVLAGLISLWPWDLAHRFSRATPYRDVIPGPLTATYMYIVYNVTHIEYSRNVNHHTRCVITCVGADCGRSRGKKIKTYKCFGTFIIKDGRYTFLFFLSWFPNCSEFNLRQTFLNVSIPELERNDCNRLKPYSIWTKTSVIWRALMLCTV